MSIAVLVYSRFSIYILDTFLSMKRLHGVDIELIDRPIPVQITQQENHPNAKQYHKKTLKTLSSLNYC